MTVIPIHRDVVIQALERAIDRDLAGAGVRESRRKVWLHLKNSADPIIFAYIMVDLSDFTFFGLDEFAPTEPVAKVGLAAYNEG